MGAVLVFTIISILYAFFTDLLGLNENGAGSLNVTINVQECR
jgi:hypothetical protein